MNEPSVAHEWMGGMVGLANIMTRARSFAPVRDAGIECDPAIAARLKTACRRVMEGPRHYIHDAVVHGLRVRFSTDSFHLSDYGRLSTWHPDEWRARTGMLVSCVPQLTVWAYTGVEREAEGAFYCARERIVFIVNNAWFGQLRSWVLGASGLILADEWGAHWVPGAAVAFRDRVALFLAPPALDPAPIVFAAMRLPEARFIGAGGVFVRLGVPLRRGGWAYPVEVPDAQGWRARQWLGTHPGETAARVQVQLPDGRVREVAVGDLALDAGWRAFVYPAEARAYVPAEIVRVAPEVVPWLARGRIENAPGDSRPATAEEFVERVCADPVTRTLLDPAEVFGRPRVVTEPMECLPIGAVFLLKRGGRTANVLQSLAAGRFGSRLLVGGYVAARPDRPCDEEAEARLVAELAGTADPYETFRERVRARAPVPESLVAEMEMFRLVAQCAPAFELDLDPVAPEVLARVVARTTAEPPGEVALPAGALRAFLEEVPV